MKIESIFLSWGTRQGCPLSLLLFATASEPLAVVHRSGEMLRICKAEWSCIWIIFSYIFQILSIFLCISVLKPCDFQVGSCYLSYFVYFILCSSIRFCPLDE